MTYSVGRPLRVMFLATSMPVGGAETLLLNLVRRIDPNRFSPEVACLKERGPLGEDLSRDFVVHDRLISHKFDVLVLKRLWRLMRQRQIDAVVTVGAGDKMFWGRLAASLAGVPVIVSALHSTGWPDSLGRLNRLLTPLTDAFVGVADAHGKHLVGAEGLPETKVFVIHNGVDTSRFTPGSSSKVRKDLGLSKDAKVIAILAALRPEKNHQMFLSSAAEILSKVPKSRFLVIGDGPCRPQLEQLAREYGVDSATRFLGSRPDVEQILKAVDVLALTSLNEASPVSILEGLSCAVPAVAADVGSVSETVVDNVTGKLFPVGDQARYVEAVVTLLNDDELRTRLGSAGREYVVEHRSLDSMVSGYESLLEHLFALKTKKMADVPSNIASSNNFLRSRNLSPVDSAS